MRRFRGATVADETSGSVITYDNTNDQFSVDGGPAAGGAPSNPGGRVRATLAPRAAASAPGSAGTARAPAAAASVAPARLRSTITLPPESR
jgi:lipopolysaccharide export system protein LptA